MSVTELNPRRRVELIDNALVVHDMVLTGTVVALAHDSDAAELPQLLSEVVELGAIIKRSGQTQSFVATLDAATERLEQTLDRRAAELPGEIKKSGEELLVEMKKQLAAFDLSRVDSIPNTMVTNVTAAGGDLLKQTLDRLLGEGGALAAMLDRVNAQLEVLAGADRDIVQRLTQVIEKAETAGKLEAARERGTQKGLEFEDHVLPVLELIHGPLGDEVIHVGKQYGADNTQTGDFVIKINPRETRGRDLRIAVETKTGRITNPKSTEELAGALSNREAAAAILVFDGVEDAQSVLVGRRYGQRSANTFAVVLDPDDGNELALEVACRYARALALASLDAGSPLDGQRLLEQCERLGKVIDSAADIKRGANEARRGLERIDNSYETLRTDAFVVLDEIRTQLAA